MIEIVEYAFLLLEGIQFHLNLTLWLLEFFNLIEPTLSSLGILAGFFVYLYKNLIQSPALPAPQTVTPMLMSDDHSGLKKNEN